MGETPGQDTPVTELDPPAGPGSEDPAAPTPPGSASAGSTPEGSGAGDAGDAPPGAHPPPTRRSTWTPRERLVRVVWATLGRVLWALLPGARASLIRLFGGRVGAGCRFARSVEVTIPWHIRCGDNVIVGDRVALYSLGVITLGDGVVLDCKAHLCAGTHDMTDSRFPLLRPPITLGAGTFVGIDAYIGPGVTLGDGCRVWPRASVYRDFDAGTDLIGCPAKAADAAARAAWRSVSGGVSGAAPGNAS